MKRKQLSLIPRVYIIKRFWGKDGERFLAGNGSAWRWSADVSEAIHFQGKRDAVRRLRKVGGGAILEV